MALEKLRRRLSTPSGRRSARRSLVYALRVGLVLAGAVLLAVAAWDITRPAGVVVVALELIGAALLLGQTPPPPR